MPRRREDDRAGATPTLREPRYSQSLERGLAILGCFTTKRPMLGIAELTKRAPKTITSKRVLRAAFEEVRAVH